MTQMTKNTDKAGTDWASGLHFTEQAWAGDETSISIEAVEGDGVCMEITATVHDEAGLDALIAELNARRFDLQAARTLADS